MKNENEEKMLIQTSLLQICATFEQDNSSANIYEKWK